jgi:hypothetical protein
MLHHRTKIFGSNGKMNTGAHVTRADFGKDADFHEFPKKTGNNEILHAIHSCCR